MKQSAGRVLAKIWQGVRWVVRKISLILGYMISGVGIGLAWVGAKLKRCGGKPEQAVCRSRETSREVPREDTLEPATKAPEVVADTAGIADEIPTTREEIFAVLKSAPHGVFSREERRLMENILTLDQQKVSELMLPKEQIVYVKSDEVLGPVVLSELYKSNMAHFPVVNKKNEVVGAIHTSSLNSLENKDTPRASKVLDPLVCYVREDYTLGEALDTFVRRNCYFLLVVNKFGKTVGILNLSDLMKHLCGARGGDDFWRDEDALAVAKRRFPEVVE